ncbi:spore germination protein [Clostridium fermenticellae]|uniref:Spore germination protein n=1 Tax=Clostridium fermenticellae TaxID=2068654 RepID=A0A386H0K9_9CLOT|nr:spore germination protein [Clostridium fermenticellae]AYD39176.1 spore germination protein [Clostridium fermenticellae]
MKENIKDEISVNIDENKEYLKKVFEGSSDTVLRQFYIGKFKATLTYIDGMSDKILLDDYIMENLMLLVDKVEDVKSIKDTLLTVTDLRESDKLSQGINAVLSGDTLMMIDGLDVCYIIATRAWASRSVGEPSGETTIRGGRDGFTETIRFNTVLLRRRIRDTRLKLNLKSMGVRSKTDVVIAYIDDIVDKDILDELNSRLSKINIDAILDSGYIEQLIEDDKWSIFPQIQSTERPDVVAASLYEGRIAILVDNSPFALIVPSTFHSFFQSPDDYYQRWIYSSAVRIIRFISIFISLLMPALYVAVSSFHTSIIPAQLTYFIASTREGVPFPAFVEAIIMEGSLAFLLEGVARLPKAVGSTVGIVGGLIIGQAAVSAGIVSPIMIIIVSITALTSFTTPNYGMAYALRILRFFLIIMAAVTGLYGIIVGLIFILIHLVRLKSFGISYLSPLVKYNSSDFKDMIIRAPIEYFKKRPNYMKTQDKIRQR